MVEQLGGKWLDILRRMMEEVYAKVNPLLGTPESEEVVGVGFGGDVTKRIDAVAEDAIIRFLERNDLSCIFIGEERGVQKVGAEPKFYIVVDGVDGTTNAVRGIRFTSASVAISTGHHLDDVEAAAVLNLDNGGIYMAEKGGGAQYNGGRIKTSQGASLRDAVLSVDLSQSIEKIERAMPLIKAVKSVRSFGSAALEICYVASGLLDAYVDIRGKLRITDIAAGMLILKEAGGVFLRLDGEEFHGIPLTEMNRFSLIAAANREIFNKIVPLISRS